MGEVYRARDPRLGRVVALKVLPAEFAADPERLRRFEHETRVLSGLNHPHIVTVFEVGREDSTTYMVMEFVEGKSLPQRALLRAPALQEAGRPGPPRSRWGWPPPTGPASSTAT